MASSNDRWTRALLITELEGSYSPSKMNELARKAAKQIENDSKEINRINSELDSVWETLIKVGDALGIDPEKARDMPGKPSDVYLLYLALHDKMVLAEFMGHLCTYEGIDDEFKSMLCNWAELYRIEIREATGGDV